MSEEKAVAKIPDRGTTAKVWAVIGQFRFEEYPDAEVKRLFLTQQEAISFLQASGAVPSGKPDRWIIGDRAYLIEEREEAF